MKSPINSTKHIVQTTLQTVTVSTVLSVPLIEAKALSLVGTGAEEVRTGAVVKAVYVELWLRGQDTSAGSFVCIIQKCSADSNGATAGEMANLMDYNEKNNILFTSQGLVNVSVNTATPIYRGWLKLPKGKQRFGLGESLRWTVLAQTLDVNLCGVTIYKEYF